MERAFNEQEENLSSLAAGSTVKFGLYNIDHNIFNGKEDIEWIVLSVDGSKALLVSKYALAAKPYHKSKEDVAWDSCSLREWLNEKFYNQAFGDGHKSQITKTYLYTSETENPDYDTSPGSVTFDYVYLLSIKETLTYFKTEESRKCKKAIYADEPSDDSFYCAD